MAGATSPPPERKRSRPPGHSPGRSVVKDDSMTMWSYRGVRSTRHPVSRVFWVVTPLVDPQSKDPNKLTEAELFEIRRRYRVLVAAAKAADGTMSRAVPFELRTGRRLFAALGYGSSGSVRLCISNHI